MVSASFRVHGLQQRKTTFCVAIAATAVVCFLLQAQVHFFDRLHPIASSKSQHLVLQKEPSSLNFSFSIKLLTYNRLHSLTRCLQSLAEADYGSDTVTLTVFVDHFRLEEGIALEASITQKLKEAHDLLQHVDDFHWPHGPKEIHYRTQNAGLQGQWLESWWPSSDNEFAFVVEDDMRLSPLYYKYLQRIIKTYYYDPSNYDPTVYGISLQRPRFVPGKHGNSLRIDNDTHLFLYQLVGTWGQLLFPKPWKEFRLWYDIQRSRNIKPILEGMITTGWYHRSKERIWTPWFIKFVHTRGYFNLCTHFSGEAAFSVSYRDKGVNTKREAGPDSKLLGIEAISRTDIWDMKPLKQLKRYNYCFHEVKQGRLATKSRDLITLLPSLVVNGTVLLVNGFSFQEQTIKNWLCQFSKFGIKNYLLLLDDQILVNELSRKGHAVLQTSPEMDRSVEELFAKMDGDNAKVAERIRILITVKAISSVLQAGYNVWYSKVDVFWVSNLFHNVTIYDADMLALVNSIGISAELLYIKASKSTKLFWKTIWKDILQQAVSRRSEFKEEIFEASLRRNLQKSKLQLGVLSSSLMANISASQSVASSVLFRTGKLTPDSYETVLRNIGLWTLDDELACTGVFCR